jgi:aspartyl-tRNA(Asn)/glutamyl-tRNA(Gln) amidotransferase subunit A
MTPPPVPSLAEASAAIAAGTLSPVALCEQALARIAALDPSLDVFITLTAERARAAAAQAEAEIKAGRRRGPLHGIPYALKDIYDVAGLPTTAHSRVLIGRNAPVEDSDAAARLEAAGMVLLGKVATHEFARGGVRDDDLPFPRAKNPWNPAHFAGGSSSGSGAGVAARFFTAALGSDTGGSIRLPATLCGVTGLKATQTRVSRHGVMPLSFSCDNVGPLVRTARDAARFLRVTAGQDPKDPTSAAEPVPDYEAALTGSVKGLRIAVCETYFLDGADAPVAAAFEQALAALREAGAVVTRIKAPSLAAIAAYTALVSRVEGAAIHANWMREHPGDYAIHLSARLFGGYAIPGHLYVEALSRRGTLLRQFVAEALTGHDLVATPTLRIRVPTLAETDIDADPANWHRFMAVSANTRPFNYLGLPTLSVPCGFDDRGLPVGLQLAGRPFAEATVLRAGDAFQRVTDWHRRAPAL